MVNRPRVVARPVPGCHVSRESTHDAVPAGGRGPSSVDKAGAGPEMPRSGSPVRPAWVRRWRRTPRRRRRTPRSSSASLIDERRQEAEHVAPGAAGQRRPRRCGGSTPRPRPRAPRRASVVPGSHSSIAIIAPRPRTSPITGCVGGESRPAGVGISAPIARARAARSCVAHLLDRAERRGAGDRVAAVRAAEAADVHGVHQLGAAGDGGQRQAAGDALGGGDQVGHDALVVAGEPVAGAAEAGLDLVGDEHDAVARGTTPPARAGSPARAPRSRPRPGSARSPGRRGCRRRPACRARRSRGPPPPRR